MWTYKSFPTVVPEAALQQDERKNLIQFLCQKWIDRINPLPTASHKKRRQHSFQGHRTVFKSVPNHFCSHLKMPSVWSPLRPRTSSERRVCTQGSWWSGYRSFWKAITSSREEPNMEGLKMAFLACLISSIQGFCRPWKHTHRRLNINTCSRAARGLAECGSESSKRGVHWDKHPSVHRTHSSLMS